MKPKKAPNLTAINKDLEKRRALAARLREELLSIELDVLALEHNLRAATLVALKS